MYKIDYEAGENKKVVSINQLLAGLDVFYRWQRTEKGRAGLGAPGMLSLAFAAMLNEESGCFEKKESTPESVPRVSEKLS